MALVVAFFALAYLTSWSLFAAATALAERATTTAGAVRLLGVFMPGLLALGLTAWREGSAGARRLLSGLSRWPSQAPLWFFAVFFMAAVKLAAASVHRLAFDAWPSFGGLEGTGGLGAPRLLTMFAAILVSAPVQAGEEIGWRGFALPLLSGRLGLPAASLLLGVLWAGWHLPLFFDPAGDTYLQSFPVYLLGVVALSVILAWLFWRGGSSLILVMVAHAAINNTKDIVPSASRPSASPWTFTASPVAWISMSLLWCLAAILIARMRRARLDPRDPG
jgi:membrane protease YdiL (CAAX protease family)